MAIAIACFCGRPACISVAMFCEMTLRERPLLSGTLHPLGQEDNDKNYHDHYEHFWQVDVHGSRSSPESLWTFPFGMLVFCGIGISEAAGGAGIVASSERGSGDGKDFSGI